MGKSRRCLRQTAFMQKSEVVCVMHILERESLDIFFPQEIFFLKRYFFPQEIFFFLICSALQTNACFSHHVLQIILLLIKCVPFKLCLGCTFGEQLGYWHQL